MKTTSLATILIACIQFACYSQDSKQLSDDQIRHKILGVWVADSAPTKTIEHKPDGSSIMQLTKEPNNVLTYYSTWQVKDGFVLYTKNVTNSSSPDGKIAIESNKVVSIDDYKLVAFGRNGGTNILTFYKR